MIMKDYQVVSYQCKINKIVIKGIRLLGTVSIGVCEVISCIPLSDDSQTEGEEEFKNLHQLS